MEFEAEQEEIRDIYRGEDRRGRSQRHQMLELGEILVSESGS
jgi:hypothetical protein